MNQIFNIFRKDVRRCIWEISISLLGQAAVAVLIPWIEAATPPSPAIIHILTGSAMLAQLAGVLLIVRLVHTENLVGDCQFWLTRPYEWPKLLAAKALFLFLFLYLPLAVLLGLIFHAEPSSQYSPTDFIRALFYYSALFVLPLFALATVTSTFGRLLGVGIAVMVIGIVTFTVLPSMLYLHVHGGSDLYLWLVVGLSLIVILMQYATRNLNTSRLILILVPILIFIYFQPSGGFVPTENGFRFESHFGPSSPAQ